METEYKDQDAQGANGQNSQNQNARSDRGAENKQTKVDPTAWQGDKPEPQDSPAINSGQDEASMPNTGQQGFDQYENNSRPSLENRASEDDELGEEMPEDYRRDDFIEENDLERTDQDYRDGENQSAEDQDDEDALRNGK